MSRISFEQLLRRVDLLTLRVFISIAAEGSFLKAAARENLAPSAVSKRIKDLEQNFDTVLFSRLTRNVELTSSGQEFLQTAKAMLEELERAHVRLTNDGEIVSGLVRLWSNESSLVARLARDVHRFTEQCPAVSVKISQKVTTEIIKAVASAQADLGIFPAMALREHKLEHVPYGDDYLCAILPNWIDPPAAALTLDWILDHPLIVLPEDSSLMMLLTEAAEKVGKPIIRGMEVIGSESARALALEQFGIAILPHSLIGPAASENVQMLSIEEDWARWQIAIAYRSKDLLSSAAVRLVEHLQNCAAQQDQPLHDAGR